jgi:hypothetical protein
MKKVISSGQLKNVGYILGYWVIFVAIPFLVMCFIMTLSNGRSTIMGLILLYIIFIAPFLYFIPYLLAKPKSGFLFVLFGLIAPLLPLYISFYIFFINNFQMLGGTAGLI